jgi:hypothetical protein
MSDLQGGRRDRRQHTRIAPKGTVSLTSGDHTMRGRIANLSPGGMLVSTAVTAPSKLLARAVEMELRLDGHGAEWMQASGRILRIASDAIAIRFDGVSPLLTSVIEEMSTASRAHLRTLSAILIDADPPRRSAMAEGFRAAGCRVVETSTPLEAVVRLGESSFEPDLIVIADSAPGDLAEDLRRFVERNHPRAKLVTIGDGLVEPVGSTYWLSATGPAADLEARICQILGRPSLR